ncbi:MAG TPA: hypothetical protein VN903_04250 [Polyangia bacterium]|jgi:hypothetical protein|nr:hypothetical protein [Polyangia bacterium]
MKRHAAWLAGAVAVAALVHTIAGHALAAVDPIAALLERRGAGVVAAAIGVAGSRLFLLFVAPGWALHVVVASAVRRATTYGPPK